MTEDNRKLMDENIWRPEKVVIYLDADLQIMQEGLTGKELSGRPAAVEKLADILLSLNKNEENQNVTGSV